MVNMFHELTPAPKIVHPWNPSGRFKHNIGKALGSKSSEAQLS